MYRLDEQYKYLPISDEEAAFEATLSQLVDHVNVQELGQWKEKCRLNPEQGNQSFRTDFGAGLVDFIEARVNRAAVDPIRNLLKAPIRWPVERGNKPSSEQSYEYQQCLEKIDKIERYVLQQLIPALRSGELQMQHRSEVLPAEIEETKQKLLKQFAPELITELSNEQIELLRAARKSQRTIWLLRTLQEEYVQVGNERFGDANDDSYIVALIGLLDDFGYVELYKRDRADEYYRLTAKGIKAADSCEAYATGLVEKPSARETPAVTRIASVPSDEATVFWTILHQKIVSVAKPRFESGHYADSVEASFKAVNKRVKDDYRTATGKELDGQGLMTQAFSLNNPVIVLDDLTTQSGKDIQQGYMQIFAGSMTGIRNPKAHDNISIDQTRAIHLLYLASLLMYKLDDAAALPTAP